MICEIFAYLDAGLGELGVLGQSLPGTDAWIMRLIELALELIKLIGAERGAVATEFR